MINKQRLEELRANITAGMTEAQANVYRAQGALELIAHLNGIMEAEAQADASSTDKEATK